MRNSKKTILIIDDSLVQSLALLRLFKQWDVNVLCAENGKDGLELARQALSQVILLDVQMPGITGLEVCRLLQENTRTNTIPVILFTSLNDLDTLRAGFVSGAVEFIPKDGFHEVVLVETLGEMKILKNASRLY